MKRISFDKRDHIYIIAIRVKRLHVENGEIKWEKGRSIRDIKGIGTGNWSLMRNICGFP